MFFTLMTYARHVGLFRRHNILVHTIMNMWGVVVGRNAANVVGNKTNRCRKVTNVFWQMFEHVERINVLPGNKYFVILRYE